MNSQGNKLLVSVLLPVYNAQEFISASVESILRQTYTNFELIIVDDGSTDDSLCLLNHFAKIDKRIKLFSHPVNQGVSQTMKIAIQKARGDYLARMDADDIALPNRLEKQVRYLNSHPDTIAIGGQCVLIDEHNNCIGQKKFPIEHEKIHQYAFTFTPLQEPTLMIARKRLPDDFAYYVANGNNAEEVELIFKLFQYGKVENLPDVLLQYRIHNNNNSLKNIRKTFYQTLIGRIKGVFLYGYRPSVKDIAVNIAQLIIVTVTPQKISLWLYHRVRKIIWNKKQPSNTFKYVDS